MQRCHAVLACNIQICTCVDEPLDDGWQRTPHDRRSLPAETALVHRKSNLAPPWRELLGPGVDRQVQGCPPISLSAIDVCAGPQQGVDGLQVQGLYRQMQRSLERCILLVDNRAGLYQGLYDGGVASLCGRM